jgi:hypothetical protein
MPMKFFIWTGEIPQVEDQTVFPSGSILNPMPADGYIEHFTPFSMFFKGDDRDRDARTHVVAYFSTKADVGRWSLLAGTSTSTVSTVC